MQGFPFFHNQKIWILTTVEARRGRAVEMWASLCGGFHGWASIVSSIVNIQQGENVVWLFLGVANTSIILHDDEFLKYLKDHQENFRFERM